MMSSLLAGLIGGNHVQRTTYESGGLPITMDYVLPSGSTPFPAVVLLHGSDGIASSGKRFRLIMQGLAALGYAAGLPHYFNRTGDEDIGVGEQRAQSVARSFPEWQEAVRDAVGAAARLPGVDSARVALVGFSLGSFLALGAAANNERVRCVIEFCGGLPESVRGKVETMPPVLILHGEADRTVPVARAHELQQELTAKGLPHEMHLYPGQGHFLTGAAEADAFQHCRTFLAVHLLGSG